MLLMFPSRSDMMVMKSFYTTTGKIVCRQTIVAPLRNSSGAITGFVLNGLPTRAEDLPRLIRVCGQQFRHMGCKPPLNHGATVIPSVPGMSMIMLLHVRLCCLLCAYMYIALNMLYY